MTFTAFHISVGLVGGATNGHQPFDAGKVYASCGLSHWPG